MRVRDSKQVYNVEFLQAIKWWQERTAAQKRGGREQIVFRFAK